MGTAEQKARRENWNKKSMDITWGLSRGQNLRDILISMGVDPDNSPLANQFKPGGFYDTYGPSANIGMMNDWNAGEQIPYMGPGEEWYNPSVASNWQKIPELELNNSKGYYKWRDTPEARALAANTATGKGYGSGVGDGMSFLQSWLMRRPPGSRSGSFNAPGANRGLNAPGARDENGNPIPTTTPTPVPTSTSTPFGTQNPGVTAQSKAQGKRPPVPMPAQPYGYATLGQPYGYSSVKPPRPTRQYSLGG